MNCTIARMFPHYQPQRTSNSISNCASLFTMNLCEPILRHFVAEDMKETFDFRANEALRIFGDGAEQAIYTSRITSISIVQRVCPSARSHFVDKPIVGAAVILSHSRMNRNHPAAFKADTARRSRSLR